MAEKDKKKKVQCPECETDVELSEEGEGMCSNCNLNVGAVYQRARHIRATNKLLEGSQTDKKKAKTTDPFSF